MNELIEIEEGTTIDTKTEKVIEETIYTNDEVQTRTRIVLKEPQEIINDTVFDLKLKIAKGIATQEEKEDLRLLTY